MKEGDLESYTAYLRGLRLRYFHPDEVTSYATRERGNVTNSLPPEELWDNLPPTLWIVDALRHYLKKPITLTSIYRSPAYNKAIGSGAATKSQHIRNAAIDFQIKGMSPHAAYLQLKRMRDGGAFLGGLGSYTTFCHVDTRGANATW